MNRMKTDHAVEVYDSIAWSIFIRCTILWRDKSWLMFYLKISYCQFPARFNTNAPQKHIDSQQKFRSAKRFHNIIFNSHTE